MNILRTFQNLLLAVFLLASTAMAWADWELDNNSSTINFVSVKNDSIGELHSFDSLVGYVGAAGNAQITVNLESVETLIDVRNERMRELLFETVQFPVATITAQIDQDVLAMAAEGSIFTIELPFTLSLHGQEKALTASLVIVGEDDNRLRVFSATPILINAADFSLTAGVAALQKVAGLQAISTAIPVTLQLQFVKVQ
jgi:polyisoprenoid-binding protein YceI